MAELGKELGLTLGGQRVESLSAGAPTSPSPRSAEAPQDEIQSRERSETTGNRPEEAQSQDDHGCSSTFIDEQQWASRTSRHPPAASEAVPVAEYQEWPFQGSLKRTKIVDDVMCNLEFNCHRSRKTFTYRLMPKHWTPRQRFRLTMTLRHIPRNVKHRCSLRQGVLNGQPKRMQRCSK
jgi:hypothetical protein